MLKDQKELADVFYERERDKKAPWYSDLLILKRGCTFTAVKRAENINTENKTAKKKLLEVS